MAQNKYRYQLTSGKSLVLEGEIQPSDEEVESIAREQGVQLLSAPEPEPEPQITTFESQVPTEVEEPEKGFLRRGWEALTTPLVEQPESLKPAMEQFAQDYPIMGGISKFIAQLPYQATSPLDVAMGGTTGGASIAARAGLPTIAKGLQYGTKALSAPLAAEGAYNIATGETWPERVIGGLELAGGLFGLKGGPKAKPTEVPLEVTPPIRRVEVPEGRPVDIVSDIRQRTVTPKTADTIPQGTIVTIKSGLDVPTKIKQAQDAGFEFAGQDAQGNFRFKKVTEPVGEKPLPAPRKMEVKFDRPVGEKRPVIPEVQPLSKSAEPIIRRIKDVEPEQAGPIREAWNLAKGTMAVDLPFITSAAFRQGHQLIGTPNWFKAWGPSIRAYGSKNFFEANNAILKADPLIHRPTTPMLKADGTPRIDRKSGRPVYKEQPSIADRSGVHLTDLKSISSREETIRSQLAEKIPVWGRVVAASNRSYVAWINNARVGALRNFYEAMPDKNNDVALRQLGDAVNAFTGRGKMAVGIPETTTYFGREYKIPFGGKETSLEKYAQGLSEVFWSPKLQASRLQALNPINYVLTEPQVRKEYLKAALRSAGAWTTLAGLGKLAGAEVNLDSTSTDFGKMKFGNFRMDPAGGFQQWLVLASRLAEGESTSSLSNKVSDLSRARGPYDPTYGSVIMNFVSSKLHPRLRQIFDAAYAGKGRPYHVIEREFQTWVPMITGDLVEIAKEEPQLVPFIAPLVSAGVGAQFYGPGEEFNKPFVTPFIEQVIGTELPEITLGR